MINCRHTIRPVLAGIVPIKGFVPVSHPESRLGIISQQALPYTRFVQVRKLEGRDYQHKFAAGCKSLSFRCRDFVVVWKKFCNDNYLFDSRSSFCNIFYNWESSRGP